MLVRIELVVVVIALVLDVEILVVVADVELVGVGDFMIDLPCPASLASGAFGCIVFTEDTTKVDGPKGYNHLVLQQFQIGRRPLGFNLPYLLGRRREVQLE